MTTDPSRFSALSRWYYSSPTLLGAASALTGLGLCVPAITGWYEQGTLSVTGGAVLLCGVLLFASGSAAFVLGLARGRSSTVPASVRGAVLINALFLGLLALEISGGIAREAGVIALSLFFYPPALALFWGLLAGRRWAWHIARWGSLLCALFYLGLSGVACVLRPTDAHGRVWIWIASVGIVLGSLLLLGGFYALGRHSARLHFGAAPRG